MRHSRMHSIENQQVDDFLKGILFFLSPRAALLGEAKAVNLDLCQR